MTTEKEIKTLTRVCRLLADGCYQNAIELLDTIEARDARDDRLEPEKPAKCEHEKTGNKHTQFVGLHGEWWIYHCGVCGSIGRRKPQSESQVPTEWWPEATT